MAEIEVQALKYDGSIHRSWSASLVKETPELFVLYGEFENAVKHPELGTIRKGTGSFEYYWKDEWFNVFRFLNSDRSLRLYYCNVNMPPKLKDGVLTFVDLDLDIIVEKDFSYRLLDKHEFEANAERFSYPSEVVRSAQEQVSRIIASIKERSFPFDGSTYPESSR